MLGETNPVSAGAKRDVTFKNSLWYINVMVWLNVSLYCVVCIYYWVIDVLCMFPEGLFTSWHYSRRLLHSYWKVCVCA